MKKKFFFFKCNNIRGALIKVEKWKKMESLKFVDMVWVLLRIYDFGSFVQFCKCDTGWTMITVQTYGTVAWIGHTRIIENIFIK